MITIIHAICLIFTVVLLIAGYLAVRSTILEERQLSSEAECEVTFKETAVPFSDHRMTGKRAGLPSETSTRHGITLGNGNLPRIALVSDSGVNVPHPNNWYMSNRGLTDDNRELFQ